MADHDGPGPKGAAAGGGVALGIDWEGSSVESLTVRARSSVPSEVHPDTHRDSNDPQPARFRTRTGCGHTAPRTQHQEQTGRGDRKDEVAEVQGPSLPTEGHSSVAMAP